MPNRFLNLQWWRLHISPGNLFPCLIILTVRNAFLLLSQHFPCYNLSLLPLALSAVDAEDHSLLPSLLHHIWKLWLLLGFLLNKLSPSALLLETFAAHFISSLLMACLFFEAKCPKLPSRTAAETFSLGVSGPLDFWGRVWVLFILPQAWEAAFPPGCRGYRQQLWLSLSACMTRSRSWASVGFGIIVFSN